ncbi:MAG: hypothetical protein LUC97_02990 [Clostridiales bacterium]|nr:hypothetical protein [Clostridiales bacterium]
MNYVYSLEIMYEYGDDGEFEDYCFLGYYSSEEKAKQMVNYIRNIAYYSKYNEECFIVEKHEINRKWWAEGFITYNDM